MHIPTLNLTFLGAGAAAAAAFLVLAAACGCAAFSGMAVRMMGVGKEGGGQKIGGAERRFIRIDKSEQ